MRVLVQSLSPTLLSLCFWLQNPQGVSMAATWDLKGSRSPLVRLPEGPGPPREGRAPWGKAASGWSEGELKPLPGRSLPRYLVVMEYGVCIHVLARGHTEPQFPHEVHLVGERHGGPWAGAAVST